MTHHSKVCFKCGAEKPLSEFYAHLKMTDGHLNKCKSCTKRDVSKNRKDNIEAIRAYDRERPNRTERNIERGERQRKDRNGDPDKFRETQRKYREEEQDKYRARTAVSNALRDGRLIKPACCENCGSDKVLEGHHDSYLQSDWLAVRWLCIPCHKDIHKQY